MTEQYEPELGQALFGQPHKEFAVSNLWEAALAAISDALARVMWNIDQKEYDSPFANTGSSFTDLPEFQVHAYSWDESVEQPFNFKWRDVEISWYKHAARGLSANQKLSSELASEMLDDCLSALSRFEGDAMRARGLYWP
jgi:hypothetical protein